MTPSDSEKLEPCPFCGGPADAIARVDPGYEPDVHCRKSDCGGYAETVTAWNTRAPDSGRQQGGVEAMRAAIAGAVLPGKMRRGNPALWSVDDVVSADVLDVIAAVAMLATLTTQPASVDASAAKGEEPVGEIDPMFWKWLGERDLQPDPDGDGTVDWLDIITALEEHEVELTQPAPDSGSLSPASGWAAVCFCCGGSSST